MDYFFDNSQQQVYSINYKPVYINSNIQNTLDMETDRRLSNTENDKKIRDQKFRMMLASIIRKMEDRDQFYIRSQFRDRVGDITDSSDNAVLELFDLLITHDIISSSNCKELVAALIDINRSDLANILQDDEKTRNKQKTSPNSFIKSSSIETAFETPITREQTKHKYNKVPKEQPSGYKHSSELVFNLNSIGNQVKFKEDRLNVYKTDDTMTDALVLKVCEELTPSDLFNLGVTGFDLSMSQVTQAKHDARSTLDAAIFIFHQWKNEAPLNSYERPMGSTMPVYSKSGLKIALKAANLNHLSYQINSPDLTNILQDDEKTRNKQKTSPNSFIKNSSFETAFENHRPREQPKHKLITREPSLGYKHRSEIAINLNSRGNPVNFKGDRQNAYKTDDTMTDALVLRVCEELTPSDLFNLGVIGFGLRMSQVTRAKDDARSALDAAISLFHQWRNAAPLNSYERPIGSTMPVYSKSGLKIALKTANLNYLAYKFFP